LKAGKLNVNMTEPKFGWRWVMSSYDPELVGVGGCQGRGLVPGFVWVSKPTQCLHCQVMI